MKKPSLPSLQTKADKIMSEYIRKKWADEHGYVSCVSCGVRKPWKEMDCGHFIPKSRGANVRYIEENSAPECPGCNRYNEGHLIGYTRWMIDFYGEDKIDELQAEARKTLTPSQKRQLVEEAIEYYTRKARELDATKN